MLSAMFDVCPPEPHFHVFARVLVTNAGMVYTLLGKNMIYYKSTNHILKGETVSDQDGVILKGGRKVIPSSLRDKKKRLHSALLHGIF